MDLISNIKRYFKSLRHHISRQVFEEALLKKNGLEKRANEIEILAMGASHCTRGFDPDILHNAYNFGIMDQDLYTTHWLFDKYIASLKKLKYLVIFYSMHSQGHELAKTRSFKTMAVHQAIFGVPYPVKEILKWKRAVRRRFKTFDDSSVDYKNFTGFIADKREICAPSAEFRVFHHLKENKRPIKQNHHVFDIGSALKEELNCQLSLRQLVLILSKN